MTDHHPRVEAAMNALYNVPVHDPTSALGLTERMTLAVIRAVDNYDLTHRPLTPMASAPYVPLREYQPNMQLMVCPNPLCDCQEVHLDSVAAFVAKESADEGVLLVMDGEDAGAHLTADIPTYVPDWIGRRHAIVIGGNCEAGHQFQLILRQHKGATQVECIPLPNVPGWDDATPWPTSQTW